MPINLNKEKLHHAYLLTGNSADITESLKKFFRKELDFRTEGNPDFYYGEYDVLGVDDARNLNALHDKRPVVSDRKIFVVSANFMTEQAQNAMLKMFEEPKGDTNFFLVMPSAGIIDTLKSRMIIMEGSKDGGAFIDAGKFLAMKQGERMAEIKNFVEEISEEEKSKADVLKFINSLEAEFKKTAVLPQDLKKLKFLEDMEILRSYASDRSSSAKMILEEISLILPVLNN